MAMKKIIQFFRDSYAELRKVVWPSRQEVASSTKVVLVSVAIFAAVLGVVDYILLALVDVIF
jgi:preprotein translocase subunit SecE